MQPRLFFPLAELWLLAVYSPPEARHKSQPKPSALSAASILLLLHRLPPVRNRRHLLAAHLPHHPPRPHRPSLFTSIYETHPPSRLGSAGPTTRDLWRPAVSPSPTFSAGTENR
ncbi:hypothetical protein K490DRAFT_60658 [Saccharata proteae CBS 121410]|uniref:Secreted protein n=1 Tax=Saccharata proteae CBS 121410 TaxID=1314787 RepID=A0A9P4LUM3_9PEZI|nr:hypothetical protein K490DRAFT_60658 [Saccharata proteae CBS 121410]